MDAKNAWSALEFKNQSLNFSTSYIITNKAWLLAYNDIMWELNFLNNIFLYCFQRIWKINTWPSVTWCWVNINNTNYLFIADHKWIRKLSNSTVYDTIIQNKNNQLLIGISGWIGILILESWPVVQSST